MSWWCGNRQGQRWSNKFISRKLVPLFRKNVFISDQISLSTQVQALACDEDCFLKCIPAVGYKIRQSTSACQLSALLRSVTLWISLPLILNLRFDLHLVCLHEGWNVMLYCNRVLASQQASINITGDSTRTEERWILMPALGKLLFMSVSLSARERLLARSAQRIFSLAVGFPLLLAWHFSFARLGLTIQRQPTSCNHWL